jgi:hypothetical protein
VKGLSEREIDQAYSNKYLALKMRLEDEMIALKKNFEALQKVLQQTDKIPKIALTPAL